MGVKAVVAKSFARIHAANLINAGILPLTFENPEDYDKFAMDDKLTLENVFEGMKNGKITLKSANYEATLNCNYTQRQIDILMAGGLLAYTKGE